jgi:hypothetical protein
MAGRHRISGRFLSCVQLRQGGVDLVGDRLCVKLIEVMNGCASEELGSAHAEVTCALSNPVEGVIGDRDRRLHGTSITRYYRGGGAQVGDTGGER